MPPRRKSAPYATTFPSHTNSPALTPGCYFIYPSTLRLHPNPTPRQSTNPCARNTNPTSIHQPRGYTHNTTTQRLQQQLHALAHSPFRGVYNVSLWQKPRQRFAAIGKRSQPRARRSPATNPNSNEKIHQPNTNSPTPRLQHQPHTKPPQPCGYNSNSTR